MNTTTSTSRPGSTGNVIAALCNFFLPGLGHLVQGRVLASFLYFISIWTCYTIATVGAFAILPLVFWIPGALLHLIAILSAATWRGK